MLPLALSGQLRTNGMIGGGIPLGLGAAVGTSIRGEDCVMVCFFYD